MNKILKNLIDKRFSVYVGGEFERVTDFMGLMSLLCNYSDFFNYTHNEKLEHLKGLKDGNKTGIYIDSQITVYFKG